MSLSTPVPPTSDPINSHDSAFVQQSSSSSALSLSPVPSSTATNTNMSNMLSSVPASGLSPGLLSGLDHYRFQLYNYAMAERLRCAQYSQPMPQICSNYPAAVAAAALAPYGPRLALSLFHNRVFQPEEPKPQHSYIGLIAIAILSSPESKLVLSDIYQHILDNYPYFRSRGPGWRNSIRHNLSLNDCFVKAGRSANGKGHYWAIHPANQEDFKKGDFRRRKAQRKVRKHMGLSVDDDGNDSPSPPPLSMTPPPISTALQWMNAIGGHPMLPPSISHAACRVTAGNTVIRGEVLNVVASHYQQHHHQTHHQQHITATTKMFSSATHRSSTRKRQFDVASLLAPDSHDDEKSSRIIKAHIQNVSHTADIDEDIDVEENEENDNNNQSAFDEETYRNHKQHKLRVHSDNDAVPANIKSDTHRNSNDAPTTDLAELKEHSIDQVGNGKKSSQYSSVCDLVESDEDVAQLTYSYTTTNEENHLDIPPNMRQHLDLTNSAAAIDPRILVGRYYGQRMTAVQQHNPH